MREIGVENTIRWRCTLVIVFPQKKEQFLSRSTIIDKILSSSNFTRPRLSQRGGERAKDGIDDAGDGISVDRPGKENSADLSETSRDIQDEKLFQRVQIKTRARHARIGEKKVGQSIRYRRFEREVGEPISKKRRELFFYREEKRDLRSATSSNRRYSMTLLVKSLNRRLNNRYSALIFPRCENGVSLLTRRRFDSRDCGITRRDVYRFGAE